MVLMTDGRANIARDGTAGRAQALEDAIAAARRMRAAGIASLAIDTSPTFQPLAEPPTLRVAQALGASYIRLPQQMLPGYRRQCGPHPPRKEGAHVKKT